MPDRKNDPVRQAQQRQRELIALKKAQQGMEPITPAPATPQAPLTPKQKVQNFWFYHRFHLLALAFVAVVVAVCVTQCVNRPKYDYQVVLFTYSGYTDAQLKAIEAELARFGEDCDGNGKVQVGIVNCSYSRTVSDPQTQNASMMKLQALLANEPDALLFLTDADSFEALNQPFEGGLMADLSLPENDGRAYCLPDAFYRATAVPGFTGDGSQMLLPEGIRISRRIVAGTAIAEQEKTTACVEQADALLQRLIAAYS